MDRNDAPGALDTELLEEGRCNHCVGAGEGVRVQKRAADDANEDDAESSPEDLRAVANGRAASHSSQISHNLCDCDGVRGEFELVCQHGRVNVLRTMRHEVKSSH